MQTILHIISRDAWEAARHSPELSVPSLHSEGFIHFSTAEQLVGVANKHYRGMNDALVLVVDAAKLPIPLRWEAPNMQGDTSAPAPGLFPHLYCPLNTDAVRDVIDLPCRADGTFQLPAALEKYLRHPHDRS